MQCHVMPLFELSVLKSNIENVAHCIKTSSLILRKCFVLFWFSQFIQRFYATSELYNNRAHQASTSESEVMKTVLYMKNMCVGSIKCQQHLKAELNLRLQSFLLALT